MLISYFIPEDGDSQEHPNVFECPGSVQSLTVAALRKVFPVPGKYHFRAVRLVGNMNVWLDLVDEAGIVPSHNGEITLKVTRISLEAVTASSGPRASLQTSAPPSRVVQETKQPSSPLLRTQQEPAGRQDRLLSFDNTPTPVSQPAPVNRRGSEKLLSFDNFDDSPSTTVVPPQATSSPFENSDSFFDFSSTAPITATASKQQPPLGDFMSFASTTPPPSNSALNSGQTNTGLNSGPNRTNAFAGMGGMGGNMGMNPQNPQRGMSGNMGAMNQMNPNPMWQQQQQLQQQQQQQQNKSRNGLGGIDPFAKF